MGVEHHVLSAIPPGTVAVGAVSADAERLMRVTKECLMAGVDAAKPGGNLRDISAAIQTPAEKA